MSNKFKIIFSLIFLISFEVIVYSQPDSKDTSLTNSNTVKIGEKELGLGWAINTNHKFSVISFKYYSQRKIWNDKIRLRFDFDGYRITKYVIPEYERFLIQTDYRINLKSKKNYDHILLPKVGVGLTFDFYDGSSPTKQFGFTPNIGIDYVGRIKRLWLQTKNTITFFGDGLWYELNPSISYRIYKNIYLKMGMNIVMSYTFNGNSAVGLYPGVSINLIPYGVKSKN